MRAIRIGQWVVGGMARPPCAPWRYDPLVDREEIVSEAAGRRDPHWNVTVR
jgi:hypothetical protein